MLQLRRWYAIQLPAAKEIIILPNRKPRKPPKPKPKAKPPKPELPKTLQKVIPDEKLPDEKPKPPGKRGPHRRTISTLTPSEITQADHLDLSNLRRLNLSFPLTPPGAEFQPYYENASGEVILFPPNTRGFFYFGPQPGLPPLAASFRFRCTPTDDPAYWAAGHDLLRSNGLPWQTLLAQVAVSKTDVLCQELLHEGHLTPESLKDWRRRMRGRHWLPSSHVLFGLGQLLPVDFGASLNFHVLTEKKVYPVRLRNVFCGDRAGTKCVFPFRGSGLARFERSQTDANRLHLRIVKLLTPVSTSGDGEPSGRMLRPLEGALLSVRPRRGWGRSLDAHKEGEGEPWAFDVRARSATAMALKALVTASEGESARPQDVHEASA